MSLFEFFAIAFILLFCVVVLVVVGILVNRSSGKKPITPAPVVEQKPVQVEVKPVERPVIEQTILTGQPNAISIIIIVLLILLALFWIAIGLLQLGIGSLSLSGLTQENGILTIFTGIWNILISMINLWVITGVIKRKKFVVASLLVLGISGFSLGLIQLLNGVWLQVCAVPLYIILAVLGLVNRNEYTNP